jgi:hypothetical protein
MPHNPEVAGSNPAPATNVRGWFRTRNRPFACSLRTDLCTGACSSGALARTDLHGGERSADDQLRQGSGDLAVGFEIGLDVLLHRERDIRMSDALAQRLPVDLRIAARYGVAVPDVVLMPTSA